MIPPSNLHTTSKSADIRQNFQRKIPILYRYLINILALWICSTTIRHIKKKVNISYHTMLGLCTYLRQEKWFSNQIDRVSCIYFLHLQAKVILVVIFFCLTTKLDEPFPKDMWCITAYPGTYYRTAQSLYRLTLVLWLSYSLWKVWDNVHVYTSPTFDLYVRGVWRFHWMDGYCNPQLTPDSKGLRLVYGIVSGKGSQGPHSAYPSGHTSRKHISKYTTRRRSHSRLRLGG